MVLTVVPGWSVMMGSTGEQSSEHSFTSPPQKHDFDGLLFDFDGTLIDSTQAIEAHWHHLGKELGVDPNVILATSHGRRSIDTLRIYDEKKANWDYICEMEGRIPHEWGSDATEIPGARQVIASLEELQAKWAVVTSGTRPLIDGWLDVMKLARPKHLITAEGVQNGKPDPEGYLMGKMQLGLGQDARVLVVEDSPSGVRAGKAAGCKVLGLATTHRIEQVLEAGADWVVRDLKSFRVVEQKDGITVVEIRDSLLLAS